MPQKGEFSTVLSMKLVLKAECSWNIFIKSLRKKSTSQYGIQNQNNIICHPSDWATKAQFSVTVQDIQWLEKQTTWRSVGLLFQWHNHFRIFYDIYKFKTTYSYIHHHYQCQDLIQYFGLFSFHISLTNFLLHWPALTSLLFPHSVWLCLYSIN